MIWANLLHLSMNMWGDGKPTRAIADKEWYLYRGDALHFEESMWNDILAHMVEIGMNMVVIDLGDAVKYESHPEIAVKGAWSRAKLTRELAKLRKMGLEPIPKLNFSACHDVWLGPYSHMVSSDIYYQVCKDLIAEVIELFDKPRFFHLGMDEETYSHQRRLKYIVIRQEELWWHDMLYLIKQVERNGVRAWIWSDYMWHHGEEFLKRMPKSVLQSNWYYDMSFSTKVRYVESYLDLEARKYDQLPTGSNWADPGNFERLVSFCTRRIASKRLFGFMQTVWKPTTEEFRQIHFNGLEKVARAKQALARRSH